MDMQRKVKSAAAVKVPEVVWSLSLCIYLCDEIFEQIAIKVKIWSE